VRQFPIKELELSGARSLCVTRGILALSGTNATGFESAILGPPQAVSRRISGKNKDDMKKLGFAGVMTGIAMLFATTALAAEKGSMKLFDPTLVNGVQLSPGDYALQWDGTGKNLQVQILQGKKVVATTAAALVQLKAPASQNMTSTRRAENNAKALTEVEFRGKSYALAISSSAPESDVAKK